MAMIDSIPAWLCVSPYEAAAASATDSSASTCVTEAAPDFTPPSCPSSTSSSSSPPDSPFATPHSPLFPECEALADTFLAKIAAGTECLAAIAAFHHIPYPRFTLWLLQPSTQERLAALSVAIASAARLTATAALPDIVRGLKSTVDQLQHSSHPTIVPPGPDALRAQSLILRRHRALIAAASLIYRISRFTCPGQHPPPPRLEPPPRPHTHATTSRDNSAPHRSSLARLPKLDLPAIDFADLDSSPRIPSVASVNCVVQPQSAAPEHSSPTSDIVGGPDQPTISVDDALQMLTAEYDLSPEEVAELRKDSHSWIRDFIPPFAAATSATLTARPTADDG